ncbi:Phosphoribosylpyrophosphate synthetase [Candidatus Ornithobacterium hominis]|uniref:phosphoribosylpyrophosphate synthetase n=1 Tax=Candidatus Ornithobacterium hominis TaxID=2497989 RepID=UPI000E5B24B1|nr:phosphoribosylpyrophosphate synthetase [Candidatus Ornithobacterium hominis]CAI9430099.1 Phosphoribosylpyrophosphate synthetase [Candidatus Ornithobacterium hominis]SZD72623.1 Uncharacterised protein [Candidatus Ornithobacterium hominis]
MNLQDLRKFDTVVEAQAALRESGYAEEFDTKEGKVYALSSQKEYQPEELKIVADARFEGMSNPSDNMVLYVIEAKDGVKGTMLDNMGGSESAQDPELLKKIPMDKNEDSK